MNPSFMHGSCLLVLIHVQELRLALVTVCFIRELIVALINIAYLTRLVRCYPLEWRSASYKTRLVACKRPLYFFLDIFVAQPV
jgi:hypothetical protein